MQLAGDWLLLLRAYDIKRLKKDFDKLGECTYNEGRQFRIPSRKRRKRG